MHQVGIELQLKFKNMYLLLEEMNGVRELGLIR